jgi:TolA-binding protein
MSVRQLFGIAALLFAIAGFGPAQAPKTDPKKADPKKADPKKTEPRQPAPKQPSSTKTDPTPLGGTPPAKEIVGPLSPLDLVRGLREAGMADLAVEYLREIESKPLSASDRAALPLERARCLLEAAEQEAEEGTRSSMIGEAKEAFSDFIAKNPRHPRAAEASLSIARLSAIEAAAQLNRARRMEIPPPPSDDDPARGAKEKERDAVLARRRDEARKAQPLFISASKQFAEAARQLKTRLEDKTLPPFERQNLAREAFDAELAAAINHYNLAETVVAANSAATQERVKYLEEAREGFARLAKGPPTSRTVWVARAWMAETLMDQSRPNEATPEFDAILKSSQVEAEEGKRLVKFFQIRRSYLAAVQARSAAELRTAENALRGWLEQYGNSRKSTSEVIAARFYRAFTLQLLGEIALPPAPKDGRTQVIPAAVRSQFTEAEKIYRALAQSDNDYTLRAARNRMVVVRRLLGDADKPPSDYTTFESAQMASLIQISKLHEAERDLDVATARRNEAAGAGGKPLALIAAEAQRLRAIAEVPERKQRIVALLERARELASSQESSGDLTDILLRLVYFYQNADQPQNAAVLGEHIARTKLAGSKSSMAGLMALNGYMAASSQVKVDRRDPSRIDEAEATAAAMRKADRDRAVELARYIDKTYPNDLATDAARHRLAALLVQDRHFDQAFDVVIRIRAGYPQLTDARNLEGYIAHQLIGGPTDMPLPAGGKVGVYRRAVDDLARVVRPGPEADEEEVRDYFAVRVRLGMLYLAQSHADEEEERKASGYDRALALADELLAIAPTFTSLIESPGVAKKELNLDGREVQLLVQDLRTRAQFLRCRALVDGGPEKLPAALSALEPVIAEVSKGGALLNDKTKQWIGGEPGDSAETIAQKAKIGGLMSGIDKVRNDTILLGFKLFVRQGKPDEAGKMLDLLKKTGGSVAENQNTYELMARELAAPIAGLKRQKKDAEAKALGDGVALLLKELAAVPNLSASSILFIGQTLHIIERHDEALAEFQKIKPPSRADWATLDLDKLPDIQERNKLRSEIRDYRFAQLYIARALLATNKVDEAEKLLTGIVGTESARGWGFSSIDFRRELAHAYEARAAAQSDVKAANPIWVQALREWTMLFQFAQNRVKDLPPDADPVAVRAARSAFFDAFYEIQRVMVAANTQLQAGNPANLKKTLDSVGKKIADMETTNKIAEREKSGQSIITMDVWNHYCDLLEKYPAVKDAYVANGGKLFLERPGQ